MNKKLGALTVTAIPILLLSFLITQIDIERYNIGAAFNLLTQKPYPKEVPNPPSKEYLVRQAPVIDKAVFTNEDVTRTLNKAIDNIIDEHTYDDEFFEFQSYLGPNFVSQYYVVSQFLGKKDSKFDPKVLYKLLSTTQYPDGSWANVVDGSVNFGDIDTTIYNYWALKVMGEPLDSTMMTLARNFILSKGGIERGNALTRYWLTFFNNRKWNENMYIPLFLFTDGILGKIINFEGRVAQWVYPHVLPITYCTYFKVEKDLGSRFELFELLAANADKPITDPLFAERPAPPPKNLRQDKQPEYEVKKVIERLFKIQQPSGSLGGYTVSTLFGLVAMQDFVERFPENEYSERAQEFIKKGYEFIEMMYFENDAEYMGNLCNGRFWETILGGIALYEAGYTGPEVLASAKYLGRQQQSNGAIPYGIDFWYAPDFDDTAEVIILWSKYKENQEMMERVDRATKFLLTIQNDDGGFPAFNRERQGYALIKSVTAAFADAAEIWDPSCPDVTGHVLESLGISGYNYTHPSIKSAIDYLEATQKPSGGWEARWGNNYIYSFGAVIPGLKKVGYDLNKPWVRKSVSWILQHQNLDGGFGESPLSYKSEKWTGIGVSTPSQTAWALLGLLEIKKQDIMDLGNSVERAVQFLINEMDREGKWEDKSVVGTGHRGFLMMMYLAYPYTWPLMALSRYYEYFGGVDDVNILKHHSMEDMLSSEDKFLLKQVREKLQKSEEKGTTTDANFEPVEKVVVSKKILATPVN